MFSPGLVCHPSLAFLPPHLCQRRDSSVLLMAEVLQMSVYKFLRTAFWIVSSRIRRHFLCSSFHHWSGNVDRKKCAGQTFFIRFILLVVRDHVQEPTKTLHIRAIQSINVMYTTELQWFRFTDFHKMISDRDNKLITRTASVNQMYSTTSLNLYLWRFCPRRTWWGSWLSTSQTPNIWKSNCNFNINIQFLLHHIQLSSMHVVWFNYTTLSI